LKSTIRSICSARSSASSLQALVLAIKTLSAYLYGSDLYKRDELGIHGKFGGDLSIPATRLFLEAAPYPF
jgi:hypothetical protein